MYPVIRWAQRCRMTGEDIGKMSNGKNPMSWRVKLNGTMKSSCWINLAEFQRAGSPPEWCHAGLRLLGAKNDLCIVIKGTGEQVEPRADLADGHAQAPST